MKRVISILLLFSLAFQCFSELTTIVGFEIHKDYIVEEYCVNKDHPEMECDGSCYLHHQLQEEENQKDTNGMVRHSVEMNLFCMTDQKPDNPLIRKEKVLYPPMMISAYTAPVADFFHPPVI